MLTQKQMQAISKILEVLNDVGEGDPLYLRGSLDILVDDTFSSYSNKDKLGCIEYDSYKGWVFREV